MSPNAACSVCCEAFPCSCLKSSLPTFHKRGEILCESCAPDCEACEHCAGTAGYHRAEECPSQPDETGLALIAALKQLAVATRRADLAEARITCWKLRDVERKAADRVAQSRRDYDGSPDPEEAKARWREARTALDGALADLRVFGVELREENK